MKRANLVLLILLSSLPTAVAQTKPNIVLIYTDDVGYGDVGCYGAKQIPTPNIDRLATAGLRFTDAYSTAATCTPSRYSLLTGVYAFRNKRATVLSGDAALVIDPATQTLPRLLQKAGYRTACIGKWHLGLGAGELDWNGKIRPGPLEVGFDVSYILPATNDRVPCVYVDGHRVDGLGGGDPLQVSYVEPIGKLPTGLDHPELRRYRADRQHSNTIINRISRIGYMSGGRAAWWKDEDMTDRFTQRAIGFINSTEAQPFFLLFSLHGIHVPRAPHGRFLGKSACGLRGDAMVEVDWSVGALLAALEQRGLSNDTLVIFASDNGPVIADGYEDGALQDSAEHDPSGVWRGGKYQPWEGGTRLPFIVRWPARIKPGVSSALLSQVDLMASLGALVGVEPDEGAARDSQNLLPALLGEQRTGRKDVLQQAPGTIAIRRGDWKYIPPGPRPGWAHGKHTRKGDTTASAILLEQAYLFNLAEDPGERRNVASEHPKIVAELAALLKERTADPEAAPTVP